MWWHWIPAFCPTWDKRVGGNKDAAELGFLHATDEPTTTQGTAMSVRRSRRGWSGARNGWFGVCLLSFIFILCVCLHARVFTVCMQLPTEIIERHFIPWNCSYDLPCGC